MKKGKNKNPCIVPAILYGVITALYTAATCVYAYKGITSSVITWAICTALWGCMAGLWFHKAISYKNYKFYMDGYYEKLHNNLDLIKENIDLRSELIKLTEGKQNDGQDLT